MSTSTVEWRGCFGTARSQLDPGTVHALGEALRVVEVFGVQGTERVGIVPSTAPGSRMPWWSNRFVALGVNDDSVVELLETIDQRANSLTAQ